MARTHILGVGSVSTATPAPKAGQTSLGQIGAGHTILWTRMFFHFTITGVNTGTATGFDINWWNNLRLTYGVCITNGPSSAPNPPNPVTIPPTVRWLEWGQKWFTAEVYDLASPYAQLTTQREPEDVLSHAQITAPSTGITDAWLAWDVNDPSGLLNTTTAAGIKWGLGYNYGSNILST